MAKGAHLFDEVKILIAQIHFAHHDWGATKIREGLLQELKSLGLDQNFGPDWPSVSAVQKNLTEIRKNIDKKSPELKGLDSPFCLGTLVKYPIPPEALPVVLRVWNKRLEEAKPDKDEFSFQMSFTIRDALWVARLSKLFDDPEAIWGEAFWYSVRERAYEAIGEDMDTTDLDEVLIDEFKPKPTESKRKRRGGKS